MKNKRLQIVAISLVTLLLLYTVLGFVAVPALVKQQLIGYVERDLGHKLGIEAVRVNPFTLAAEVTGLELREPSGGVLLSFKRLFVNLQASSLYRRTWTFAAVDLESPLLNVELRKNGTSNFDPLLAALRKPKPEPEAGLPKLEIDRIQLVDGRIDLADLQAGESARLRLAPIAFELTDLSTLPAEQSPYKLTARSADGETIQWGGEISLNPIASTGKLALHGWKMSTLTRLLGNRIALKNAAGEIDATLDYRASYADAKPQLNLTNVSLQLAGLAATGASGSLLKAQSLRLAGGAFDLGARSASIESIDLARAQLEFAIGADGRSNWAAAIAQPPAQTPTAPPEKLAAPGTETGAPWRLTLARLTAAGLDLHFSDRRAESMTDLKLEQARLSLAADIEHGAKGSRAGLRSVTLATSGIDAASAAHRLKTGAIELSAAGWDTTLTPAGLGFSSGHIKLALAQIGARVANNDIRVARAAVAAQLLKLDLTGNPGSSPVMEIGGANFEASALAARPASAKQDVIELAGMSAGSKSIVLALGADPLDLKADGLSAALEKLMLRDPASGSEIARLGRAQGDGGMLATASSQVSLERIALTDGYAAATIAAGGKTSWDPLLAAFGGSPTNGRAQTKPKPPGAAAWKAVAKTIELRNFGAALTDQRQTPALAVAVQDITANARNVSSDRTQPARIQLSGKIKDGGGFSAAGLLNMYSLASDLKIKLSDLSLLPAQALIARYARLRMLSGKGALEGRLRYRQGKAAGANLLFEGEVGVDKLNLEETEPAQPFLALDTLRAMQVRLSLAPDRLDLPDLRLSGLVTKLLIAEDQTVNITKLLRPRPEAERPAPAAAAAAQAKAEAEGEDAFPVSISRIRVDNSSLEFSDLSLRPQFTTHMHDLQGVITGLATSRDTTARLELEAGVDEFGSARINGVVNLFRPRRFANIDMVFRNIEMTALTPYAAKFAGYRIASGKLSMDLHYRIKNSALTGDNKIIVDKLELGERVESPTALNLPLELAIAILKDENGRIDIGLPVSGSLEDPQFSFGAIVWKAIGSLLTRVVTAPFRALANLFGAGSTEKLDAIEFDPGSERLLPPERQKLRTVAEALQKRSQLKLTIKPAYAGSVDRAALQSLAIRRTVTLSAGIKLEPGEAPGPLDYGNERIQKSIQTLFVEKFDAPAARDLRASLAKAPAAADPAQPEPSAAPPAAARVARAMAQRLMESYPVTDTELVALGKRRGDAIAGELQTAGKIEASRVTTAVPHSVESADRTIDSELDLAVVK